MSHTTRSVLPAQPGFVGIEFDLDHRELGYSWSPIIAWAIQQHVDEDGASAFETIALTLLGPCDWVVSPDGVTTCPHVQQYPDMHAWFTSYTDTTVLGPCPHGVTAAANDRIGELVPSDVRCHACQGTGSVPAPQRTNERWPCKCCRGAGEHLPRIAVVAVTP